MGRRSTGGLVEVTGCCVRSRFRKCRRRPGIRSRQPVSVFLTAYPPLLEWRKELEQKSGARISGARTMGKCQKCTKAATYHITDVVSEDNIQDYHLCEECYHKFICDSQQMAGQKNSQGTTENSEEAEQLNSREGQI